MSLYAVTIFVSAFLLFLVQPVLAKQILPWFGGTASVWTICMVFFQSVLLLGYAYSHWLASTFPPRRQAAIHLTLLAVSLAFLPIIPDASWKPTGHEDPALRILMLLFATIGLPYLLLSSTSPLVQAWFARAYPGASPYRLFALSNFASMLALLGYPFLLEPAFPTRHAVAGLVGRLCPVRGGMRPACLEGPLDRARHAGRAGRRGGGGPGAEADRARTRSLADAFRAGLGDAACRLQPSHPEHLFHPASLGGAAGDIPPHFHPVL